MDDEASGAPDAPTYADRPPAARQDAASAGGGDPTGAAPQAHPDPRPAPQFAPQPQAGLPAQPDPHPQFHPVPAYAQQPQFPAMPASPADWRYRPPATPSWWHRHRRTVRALTLITLLTLCGLVLLGLVREQTGTVGLLVGLGLAVLPVPLLVAAFRWIDGVEPTPWRNHLFAFAWGACAATLVALLANSLATDWLSASVADSPGHADMLGATVIAPIVEETAKGTAVLLLFVFRRRDFDGVISGIALAGITATGFAFTENVLYLGTAYGEDQLLAPDALHESVTAMTFFIRIVLAPFAHPLFTAFTGIGFGMVAALPGMRRIFRVVIPFLGLVTAALLHAIWNGSASLPDLTFLAVYALFMIPVFAALTWLAVWSRRQELHTVRDTLPAYASAGWLQAPEPWGLSSMRARAMARSLARRTHGPLAARTVAEYQHFATSLALLRARANHGRPAPDFHSREQELLHHLWHRHAVAGPATSSASLTLNPPHPPGLWRGEPAAYTPQQFTMR
ncbi:PrsW family glutamic-type intramembrane protease [Streptomyces albidus (ex Kaewkla and Franco 2022)]|uniref:PrsW family intramembrane metalloprotease n=1 Tax=Streptomyces albidus (ex Kaewkla and Franco 2022) TaxID=722709 RepID=UPI003AF32C5F